MTESSSSEGTVIAQLQVHKAKGKSVESDKEEGACMRYTCTLSLSSSAWLWLKTASDREICLILFGPPVQIICHMVFGPLHVLNIWTLGTVGWSTCHLSGRLSEPVCGENKNERHSGRITKWKGHAIMMQGNCRPPLLPDNRRSRRRSETATWWRQWWIPKYIFNL